jgi:hypothetical protein
MISISSRLAGELVSVFRRALRLTPKTLAQPITFSAGRHGLRISAAFVGFAAQYDDTSPQEAYQATVPLSLLKEASGSRGGPITIGAADDGSPVIRWQNGAVPQQRSVSPPIEAVPTPVMPKSFTENPAELRQAIHSALDATDPMCSRYALGCLCLRGVQGDVTATDGHQVYRHGGFRFEIKDELLVEPSTVFGLKELVSDQALFFGATKSHAVFLSGRWTIWMPRLKEGRFPKVDGVIPAEPVVAAVELSAGDLVFLGENLPRLPGGEAMYRAVTFDLNGSVAIRGRHDETGAVTELRLTNSQRSGEELRVNCDRRYLQRAAALGFTRFQFHSPAAPIVCRDDGRLYFWASLTPEDAIAASQDAVVIESPTGAAPVPPVRHQSTPPRRTISMATRQKKQSTTTPTTTTTPAPSEPVQETGPTESQGGLVEQALALRQSLRSTLGQMNDLLRAIKRQRKQERLMRSTLSSLKQLQSVA